MKLGSNDQIVQSATFQKDAVIKYRWCGLIFLSLLIFTIPIVLVVAIVYKLILGRVIDNWECVLTTRTLYVKKGMLNTVEKTVPLEKITDLQMTQGWLMRRFNLHWISIETAGQSAPGSLIRLLGIAEAETFRQEVLDQRDKIASNHASMNLTTADSRAPASDDQVLVQIRDSLARSEDLLRTLVDQKNDG